MKTILLLLALGFAMISAAPATAAVAISKVSRKAEPAPKDRDDRSGNTGGENNPGSREETYEGNERDGGAFDGGGYEDESGGMIGEIFNSPVNASPLTRRIVKEDRGAVIVRRTTIQKNISETEVCTSVTIEVIAKQTGKVISSDRQESCNVVSL